MSHAGWSARRLKSVPARVIGQTGGNRLRIATGGRMTIDMATDDAEARVVGGD